MAKYRRLRPVSMGAVVRLLVIGLNAGLIALFAAAFFWFRLGDPFIDVETGRLEAALAEKASGLRVAEESAAATVRSIAVAAAYALDGRIDPDSIARRLMPALPSLLSRLPAKGYVGVSLGGTGGKGAFLLFKPSGDGRAVERIDPAFSEIPDPADAGTWADLGGGVRRSVRDLVGAEGVGERFVTYSAVFEPEPGLYAEVWRDSPLLEPEAILAAGNASGNRRFFLVDSRAGVLAASAPGLEPGSAAGEALICASAVSKPKASGGPDTFRIDGGSGPIIAARRSVGPGSVLIAAAPYGAVSWRLNSLLLGFAVAAAAAMALSAYFATRLASRLSFPIRRLASDAVRLASGEFAELLASRGIKEISDLADSVNKAFSELRERQERQSLLVESGARIDVLSVDLDRGTVSSMAGFRLFREQRSDEPMDFRTWVEHYHVKLLDKGIDAAAAASGAVKDGLHALAEGILDRLSLLMPGASVQRVLAYTSAWGEECFMKVNILRASRSRIVAACVDLSEEIRSRRDLAVLSDRLSYALDSSRSVAIFDLNRDTLELWASGNFYPLLGIQAPPSGIILLPQLNRLLFDGPGAAIGTYQGGPPDFCAPGVRVFNVKAAQGSSERWIEVRSSETDRGAIGTLIDVTNQETQRLAAQDRADSARELSRVILSSLSEGVIGLDAEGACVFSNPAAEAMTGFSASELKDLPAFAVLRFLGEGNVPGDEPVARALSAHEAVIMEDARLLRKDGSPFRATCRIQPIFRAGTFSGAVATLNDVTALAELSTRFRSVMAAALDEIYIKDRELKVVFASDSVLASLGGMGQSAIRGKKASELYPPKVAAEFERRELAVLESGQGQGQALLEIPSGAGSRWLALSIQPLRDERGESLGVFGIARDVTEAQRIDEELKRAMVEAELANRSKSVFLANMSHEIRTPLNAILGYSQMLSEDAGLGQGQRERVLTILRSGAHLLDLINSILEISKIEAGRVIVSENSCDLHSLLWDIEAMIRIRSDAKALTLEVALDPGTPRWIRTDIQKLRQIILNLLGNSVKFTEQGGITLRVGSCARDESQTEREWGSGGADPAERFLFFEVADSGPGLTDDDMARIFTPFEQGRAGISSQAGTGLGLAISREYATLLGGGLYARNRAGAGCVFRCELALREADPSTAPELPQDRIVTGIAGKAAKPLVLHVDDSDVNRSLVRDILEPLGFRVTDADNGAEGLDRFHDMRPDLVLMDIAMPVMDGYEAIRRIRDLAGGGDVPIIAVTASAFEEDRQKAMALGANDFIRKPIDIPEFLEKIGSALGIQYSFSESVSFSSDAAPGAAGMDLSALPPELRATLREAAMELDPVKTHERIAAIGRIDAAAADALRRMAAQYNFEAIAALCGKED